MTELLQCIMPAAITRVHSHAMARMLLKGLLSEAQQTGNFCNRVSFTAGLKQGHQQGAQADVNQRELCRALREGSVTGGNDCTGYRQWCRVREPHCGGR